MEHIVILHAAGGDVRTAYAASQQAQAIALWQSYVAVGKRASLVAEVSEAPAAETAQLFAAQIVDKAKGDPFCARMYAELVCETVSITRLSGLRDQYVFDDGSALLVEEDRVTVVEDARMLFMAA